MPPLYQIDTDVNPFPLNVDGAVTFATVAAVPAASTMARSFAYVASANWLIYSDGTHWRRVAPSRVDQTPVTLFDRYIATAAELGFDHIWPLTINTANELQFDYGSGFPTDSLGIHFSGFSATFPRPGIYPAAESYSLKASDFTAVDYSAPPGTNFTWCWHLQPNSFANVPSGDNAVGFNDAFVGTNAAGQLLLVVGGVTQVTGPVLSAGTSYFISLTRGAGNPGLYTLYVNGAAVGSASAATTSTPSSFTVNTFQADAQFQSLAIKSSVVTPANLALLYAASQVAP